MHKREQCVTSSSFWCCFGRSKTGVRCAVALLWGCYRKAITHTRTYTHSHTLTHTHSHCARACDLHGALWRAWSSTLPSRRRLEPALELKGGCADPCKAHNRSTSTILVPVVRMRSVLQRSRKLATFISFSCVKLRYFCICYLCLCVCA